MLCLRKATLWCQVLSKSLMLKLYVFALKTNYFIQIKINDKCFCFLSLTMKLDSAFKRAPLQCLMQLLLDHFAFASASFAFCFYNFGKVHLSFTWQLNGKKQWVIFYCSSCTSPHCLQERLDENFTIRNISSNTDPIDLSSSSVSQVEQTTTWFWLIFDLVVWMVLELRGS